MRKEPNHEIVCLCFCDIFFKIFFLLMPPPFRYNQDNFRLALPPPLSLTHTLTSPYTPLVFKMTGEGGGCGWFEVRYGVGQEWISMPWTNWFWVPAVRRGYTTLLHISRSGSGKATKTVSSLESSSFLFKLRDLNIVTTAATIRSVMFGFSRLLRICGLYWLFVV